MRLLKAVIGLVAATIKGVMRVRQTQTFPIGGNNNIAPVTQPQLAKQELKQKPKVAKATTRVKLPTAATLLAPTRTKKSSAVGIKPKTPVRQLPQPAKLVQKAKQKPAKPVTQGKKLIKESTPAQPRTVRKSKAVGH